MTAEIHVDLTNGVQTITLARPDKKNALTNEMYGALADTIERAQQDRRVRALLLQGDGDSFTAGNDVAEFAAIAAGKGPSERQVHRFLRALANSSVPIVAAVHGKAVGVGTTMLLHCDYVLLAQDAQPAHALRQLGLGARGGFDLSASPAHRACQGFRDVRAGRAA
jgi:enoyl-CoA hydratase/carnithine racemase